MGLGRDPLSGDLFLFVDKRRGGVQGYSYGTARGSALFRSGSSAGASRRSHSVLVGAWRSRAGSLARAFTSAEVFRHMPPRELDGTNEFWNLVPLDRGHISNFTNYWLGF
jgi:hypothetical protein